MLKKIHIINFLSCKDTVIEFENISALIGRNAAGKTNILKAIHWCAQFAVGNNNDFSSQDISINIEFSINDLNFKYSINRTIDTDHEKGILAKAKAITETININESLSVYNNQKWIPISERHKNKTYLYDANGIIESSFEHKSSMLSAIFAFVPPEKINNNILLIFNFLNGINYYNLENIQPDTNGIIIDTIYKDWLENGRLESNVPMKLLHLWHENKDLFTELESLIGDNGLNLAKGIRIEEITTNQSVFYWVGFTVSTGFVNYSQLSFGTQRIFSILIALLYDKNSTLLIEQPEDGIHSALLKKLLPLCFEYSKTYNKQLIIATHSPEIINLLAPENIRLVRMTENGTKVTSLDNDQLPYISDYIDNEGTLFEYIEGMEDR